MNRATTETPAAATVADRAFWVGVLLLLGLVGFAFRGPIDELFNRWSAEEEYGHGFLLPFVSAWFLWVRWPLIAAEAWRPGWAGLPIALAALLVYMAGEISALYLLSHYALVLLLFGIGVCILGLRTARHLVVPLAVLLFAIPIPYFIQAGLSGNLQLISSSIGVAMIAAFDIPVLLDGNVIDMGVYKLQVVEACSGLRYLFSLASLGFICACLFNDSLWKRIVLLLSTVPIAILTNSVRIGVTGILVDRYGIAMAEGFMHDFEGWSIFVVCLVVLFGEMALLARIGRHPQRLRDVFGLEAAGATPPLRRPGTIAPLAICATLVLAGAVGSSALAGRTELVPDRKPLAVFPGHLGDWQGDSRPMESMVVEKLKLNDYLMSDYVPVAGGSPVNLYIAWYDSQRSGASPHSPKVCIPGGGWEISRITREVMPFSTRNGPLHFNRAIIQRGQSRQLVYYWFQQRGRTIANEYLMKWYLFRDALVDRRSDGALVRLTTSLAPGEPVEDADRRLRDFAYVLAPELPGYIPD